MPESEPPPSESRRRTPPLNGRANPPGFKTSPIKVTAQAVSGHSSTTMLAQDTQRVLATELRGMWIGPMNLKLFFEQFMPTKSSVPVDVLETASFDGMPVSPQIEPEMYEPFVEIVNDSNFLPPETFEMFNTSTTREAQSQLMPDLSLLVYLSTTFNWNLSELCIEFKRLLAHDGFCDENAENLEKFFENIDNDLIEYIKGQLASYAAAQLAHQHRTFVLSVFICGDFARFIRWDRSGAIVTERFNYRDNPAVLAEFFWRYGQLSLVERGFDHTVQDASKKQTRRFHRAIRAYIADDTKRQLPGMVSCLDDDFPCRKIQVPDGDGKPRYYLVQKPFSLPFSVVGRSTRAYIAMDMSTKTLVFLKDYWRDASRPSEAEIYAELEDAHVPHLPVILASGDVPDDEIHSQATQTQAWRFAEGMCLSEAHKEYRHHRVVQELAFPLHAVKSSKELVATVRNAVHCIGSAEGVGWLHRDVTDTNVMITAKGIGIMNDWDHGIKICPDRKPSTCRSATWQFLACALADDPYKVYDMHDDLESCFWVLLYIGVHYLDSTAQRDHANMFDDRMVNDAPVLHGNTKRSDYLFHVRSSIKFTCGPLHDLLKALHSHFCQANGVDRTAPSFNLDDFLSNSLIQILDHFDRALKRADWPENDILPDRFVQQSDTKQNKEIRHTHMSNVSSRTLAEISQTHSATRTGEKRARADDMDDDEATAFEPIPGMAGRKAGQKRQKADLDSNEKAPEDTADEKIPREKAR
ncbi:hypothetical protein EIP91_011179 [Steccherinum ochraceum]|uniref:Fungal-type protein kinase domain-containing protein n=1 Tax=Steccherinum ochraceum TaxID=92696 RepID=A0A4R0RIB2_9APHY|nr:hypothetical protein EIP91_011179 [Steccherinum ochraceum]